MAEVKLDPELSRRIGVAIKRAIGARPQKEIAAAIPVDGGRLSRWISGELRPNLEQIRAVEEACGVGEGALLIDAGYFAPPATIPEIAKADLELGETGRRFILMAHETALALGPGDE